MISVCIITKNEIEYLKKNLHILKGYPCEIVVVDTGSTDGSIEVAKEYADIFSEYEWCNDFSKAKNYAVSIASNDIIITIDTDEMLGMIDCEGIERIISSNPHCIGRIKCLSSHIIASEEKVAIDYLRRVFNRKNYRYQGKIHEQLVPIDNRGRISVVDVPLTVNHLGYNQSEGQKKKKARRNIKLLLSELEDNSEDAYTIYQLGKAYMYADEYEKALEWFEKDFSIELDSKLGWVVDLIVNSAFLYVELGRKDEALNFESLEDDFLDSSDYFFMMGNIYMQNAMFDKAIESFLRATTLKEGQIEGNNSYFAWYNIGVIYECTGSIDNAKMYYAKCGDFDKAKEGIKRLS